MQLPHQRRRSASPRTATNGGFPEPPAGEPVRLVRRSHAACGAETRIRLPGGLPETVVHRVVCDRCHEPYLPAISGRPQPAAPAAETTAAAFKDPRSLAPAWFQGRLWPWLSLALAFVAVLVGLALIQDDAEVTTSSPSATGSAAEGGAEAAKFIEKPGFSLALPVGWTKTDPPEGAVFAARSDDGSADATLWIEEQDGLSMSEFERRSLAQLGEIGRNPRVVNRVDAPTLEGRIIELRADTPVAEGVTAPYRVTLRGAGPYRLYLATSQQPASAPRIAADVELLHSSLRPDVELGDPAAD